MYKLLKPLHAIADIGAVLLFLTLILFPFSGCDSETGSPPLASASPTEIEKRHGIVLSDSIKLHAFDNLFFGNKDNNFADGYLINNLKYKVACKKELSDGRLYSLMLVSDSKINTLENAGIALEGLKNVISEKYNSYNILNQHYYIKGPKQREINESCFSVREKLKYNKYDVGNIYEYAGYNWELKHKQIQIGYFIKGKEKKSPAHHHKNKSYTIYVQITSKVLQSLLPVNDSIESYRNLDSQKF